MFEIVHALFDWYDGPRMGIADYCGAPHVFLSDWGDGADLDCETFSLMPIDASTFAMALESWAIYRRWEEAFYGGKVTLATDPESPRVSPMLPDDLARHNELEPELERLLTIQP